MDSSRLFALCRIVTDRDTGKQKGFAFLEFFDTQTAESAIRNLNEHDLNGRKLKVHFAANDMDSKIRQGKGALITLISHDPSSHSPSWRSSKVSRPYCPVALLTAYCKSTPPFGVQLYAWELV